MGKQELKYNVFLYIQDYNNRATNFSGFKLSLKCKEPDYFFVKYQYLDDLNIPIGSKEILQDKSVKISKIAFDKWLERRKEQELIDNGIIEL